MPCVSRFFGIAIYFYFSEHSPPHFHAIYGGDEAVYEIQTLHIYAVVCRDAHITWFLNGLINIARN